MNAAWFEWNIRIKIVRSSSSFANKPTRVIAKECCAGNCKWWTQVVAAAQKWMRHRTLGFYREITFPYVPCTSLSLFSLSLSLSSTMSWNSYKCARYLVQARVAHFMRNGSHSERKTLGFGVYRCKAILRSIRVIDKSWGCERNVAERIYGIWHRDPVNSIIIADSANNRLSRILFRRLIILWVFHCSVLHSIESEIYVSSSRTIIIDSNNINIITMLTL